MDDIAVGEVDADSVGIVEAVNGGEAARGGEDSFQCLAGVFARDRESFDYPAALFSREVLE